MEKEKIVERFFERLIYNNTYEFFKQNDLFNQNQSGFRPSDSFINQLLWIMHEIYQAFDNFPLLEPQAVFLDITKPLF